MAELGENIYPVDNLIYLLVQEIGYDFVWAAGGWRTHVKLVPIIDVYVTTLLSFFYRDYQVDPVTLGWFAREHLRAGQISDTGHAALMVWTVCSRTLVDGSWWDDDAEWLLHNMLTQGERE